MTMYFLVDVYFPEPSTEIIGGPDLYIESGSTINLTCVIHNSPEPPAYIFWNHNNAVSGTFNRLLNDCSMHENCMRMQDNDMLPKPNRIKPSRAEYNGTVWSVR